MKPILLMTLLVVCLGCTVAAQGIYPVYYDCTSNGSMENATRLYVSNGNETGVRYTIRLYTPQGGELAMGEYFLNAHASHQIWLPDLLLGSRTSAWGLCLLQTGFGYPTALDLVAARYVNGSLLTYERIPDGVVTGRHAFFYDASHSPGGPENDTHVTVMNPTNTANHYRIELYDIYGNGLGTVPGVVNPKCTAVHRLSEWGGDRNVAFGLCVIRSEQYSYETFAVNAFRIRAGRIVTTETVP